MTEPLKREWYVADYADEVMPPPQDSPDGWIVSLEDGAPGLRGCEPGDPPRPLSDGDRIGFMYCDTFGSAELMIRADGAWTVSAPMPDQAKQVCALGGWQADSLAETLDGCVEQIKEALGPGEEESFDLSYYTYSEAFPFRFDAASRSFKTAGQLQ